MKRFCLLLTLLWQLSASAQIETPGSGAGGGGGGGGAVGGGSATNAIASIWTNNTPVASTGATNLNVIYGSNMVFRATNSNGKVDLHISGQSGAAYYGPFTNLLTYGNSTNFGLQSLATSYTSNALYQPVGLGNASTTLVVNMLGGSMQVVNLTADTSIVVSNATIGANVSILLLGTNNNQFKVIMPTYVRLFSGAITNIVTTNKSMIVSLTSFDSVTNNIVSTISIEP